MDSFTGGAGDDTFSALATSPTTGAAATTINSGDTIVGGAGKDTLNITSTAANNTSLSGLTVSGVEVVNLTDANNLGASTTSTAAATAGAAQVRVLDISGARYLGEVQSIDFAGVTPLTAAANITIAGQTVALAVGDTPQGIATKVKTALEGTALAAEISSVTQAGSKLTVLFKPTTAAGADANPDDTRLNVTGALTISGQVVTAFANSDDITVTVNGVDYAASMSVASDLGLAAAAAPAAPAVSTTQGVNAVTGVTAVTETNTVTFSNMSAGGQVTVADRTLTSTTGTPTAAQVAAAFASGTAPTGTSFSGTLTGFTAASSAVGDTLVFTSTTPGANVPAISVQGATVTATTQGVAAVTAVTATSETAVVTFGALAAGQSVTVGGETLTASAALTSAQVATAFGTGVAPTGGAFTGSLSGFARAAAVGSTVTYTASSTGNVTDLAVSAAGNTITADLLTNQNATRDAVKAVLDRVLAGAVTVSNGDEAGELKLTSNAVGVGLPTVTVSQGTTSRSAIDTADGATVANAVRTQVSASKQAVAYTVAAGTTTDAFAASSSFELFVDGVSAGSTAVATDTAAQAATKLAAAINTALGVSAAAITAGATPLAVANGAVVTVTAPTAGTPLPILSVALTSSQATATAATQDAITFSEVRPNQQVVGSVTTVAAASVSAASFADAQEIWLVGASGSATVSGMVAGQTIGFNGVTMANTVAFGALTSGSIAVSGSAGTLATTGNAITTLAISGTGTTGLTITDGGTVAATGADPITTLNLSTSGATVLDTQAMTSLATLTQTGAGGVTLTPGTKLASITTGAGADTLRVSTATVVDVVGTTIDETVNATVSSGAGNDRIVVATTGTGKTTVDAGEGDDTVYVSGFGSGATSISGGAGNDSIRVGLISTLQGVTIDGGAGTDTLRTTNAAFTASDYTTLSANVSGIETLEFSNVLTALNASQVSATSLRLLASGGTNTITEVASGQTVVMARTAAVTATSGFSETGASATVPSALSVASKGYILDSDAGVAGNQTVFGDNLNVTLTNTSATSTVAANGNALTLGIAALAQSGTAGASTAIAGIGSAATVTGDLQSINATLTSARGTGTNGLGIESMAGFTVAVTSSNLQNLTSVKVSGAGVVSINAGTLGVPAQGGSAPFAKLTSIDLSGMTALANQNNLGQEIGAGANNSGTVGGFENLSTSLVTLNNNISETVTLGGARDTVATGSTIAARDTITGFQLTASAANPLLADTTRSDVLKIGVNFDGSTGGNAAKMVTTAATLDAALLEAANFKNAAGANVENIVFGFGGNTYVYVDTGANGLTDNDQLVVLSGSLNLDLLVTSGVIIA